MQSSIRGIKLALNANQRYKYRSPEAAVDHIVVGGGVVGLAIAARLAYTVPEETTFLVERHSRAGEETSSRNSEVIHAGIYYPPESLKTRLCLRGRQLMYEHCKQYGVDHRKTGKLVVARENQLPYLESLHAKASNLNAGMHSGTLGFGRQAVPTELIGGDQARELEPDLSSDIIAALWSKETGIVDSHGFMDSLEKIISDSENAELVYSTRVVRVDPVQDHTPNGDEGWVVQTVTGQGDADNSDCLLARTLINASGLSGAMILNSLLPFEKRLPMYYARGSYASYGGPGVERVSRLLYPCPDHTGKQGHNFQSLGTHLTMDLQGKIRFGPDLEWLDPPVSSSDDNSDTDPDFWSRHLVPDESRLVDMYRAVTSYLPGVQLDGLQPDYAGVRPKLCGPGGGFNDFVVRTDYPDDFHHGVRGDRQCPMINLLGIESPGLTASLAIAEMVVHDMLGLHTMAN